MDPSTIATVRSAPRRALAVGFAAALIATVIVVNLVDAARPECCDDQVPYVTLYAGDRNQIEALLVAGDGQAFAALAQDPTLSRPAVIDAEGEYAYRAQRPVWGYLAWAASLGQPDLAGWALVALAILACGVVAMLLLQRGASPWWALVTLAIGYEAIGTLTPELFALALFGIGVLLWTRERRAWAIVAMCAAVLTRETMLVGVAALALWEIVEHGGALAARIRRAAPFTLPIAAIATWDVFLRVRLGSWPTGSSETRLTLPGVGLLDSIADRPSPGLALGVLAAVALVIASVVLARHDPLTWISVAYAGFATTFSQEVWVHAGFTRALLPLYVLGSVAFLGAIAQRRRVEAQAPDDVAEAAIVEPGSIRYTAASSLIPTSGTPRTR